MGFYPQLAQLRNQRVNPAQMMGQGFKMKDMIQQNFKKKRMKEIAQNSVDPSTGQFDDKAFINAVKREYPEDGFRMEQLVAQLNAKGGGATPRMVQAVDPETNQPIWATGSPEGGELTPMTLGKKPAKVGYAPSAKRIGDQVVSREGKVLWDVPKTRTEKLKDQENRRQWAELMISKERLALDKSPGWQKIDSAFAEDYNEIVNKGSLADAIKNYDQMSEVYSRLEGDENLSGAFISLLPESVRQRTNPASVDVQNMLEEVVQRNLRVILGAQFTRDEGMRLIERAYNPALDEEINAKRVGRLLKQLETALEAKLEAIDYWENNDGTLRGYKSLTLRRERDKLRNMFLNESVPATKKTKPKEKTKPSNMTDAEWKEFLELEAEFGK